MFFLRGVTPKPTTMPKPTVPTPKPKKTGFEITKKQLKNFGWGKSTRTNLAKRKDGQYGEIHN